MVETLLTGNDIRAKGIECLAANLGPVGLVRFLQQTENGWGDYTRDRGNWLGEGTVRDIATQFQAKNQTTN